MSTFKNACVVNLPAGEDLEGDLYEILQINTSGQVVKATAATDIVVGVLAEDPKRTTAAGDMVAVMLIAAGGVGLVKVASSVAAGDLLIPKYDRRARGGHRHGRDDGKHCVHGIGFRHRAGSGDRKQRHCPVLGAVGFERLSNSRR